MIKVLAQAFAGGVSDKYSSAYFNVYVNPTQDEMDRIQNEIIKQIKKQQVKGQNSTVSRFVRAGWHQMFRGRFDINGNIFLFHSWLLHDDAQKGVSDYLKKPIPLVLRFGYKRKTNTIQEPHFSNPSWAQKFKRMSDQQKKSYWETISGRMDRIFPGISKQVVKNFLNKQADFGIDQQRSPERQYDRMRQLRGV